MKVGIVGLPNVGKSTLFHALTKNQVDCANYPFCTIEPNVGVVAVPDERLNALAEFSKPEKIVPAVVEFVDIAGLVRGASEGEGLGNKFLAHIREVDAIVQVVRCFENSDVVHVEGKIDPRADIDVINTELMYADLATVEKRLESIRKTMKSGATHEEKIMERVLIRLLEALRKGMMATTVIVDQDEEKALRELHLLTRKSMLYVLNVDEEQLKQGYTLPSIPSEFQIAVSVKIESELSELPDDEAREYLQELGIKETGLDRLIRASYALLGLITFFTSGPKETRAWTITRGMKAPQAAGVIHTDFEKGFIRVEVTDWKDFIAYGEAGSREKGLMRIEGKEYIMQDGDTCYFRFSV